MIYDTEDWVKNKRRLDDVAPYGTEWSPQAFEIPHQVPYTCNQCGRIAWVEPGTQPSCLVCEMVKAAKVRPPITRSYGPISRCAATGQGCEHVFCQVLKSQFIYGDAVAVGLATLGDLLEAHTAGYTETNDCHAVWYGLLKRPQIELVSSLGKSLTEGLSPKMQENFPPPDMWIHFHMQGLGLNASGREQLRHLKGQTDG